MFGFFIVHSNSATTTSHQETDHIQCSSGIIGPDGQWIAKCKDTGYKGRQGLYEILVVSKPVKEAILRKATTPELREIAIKEGFQTMQDMGRRLIANGELNFREYERVLTTS